MLILFFMFLAIFGLFAIPLGLWKIHETNVDWWSLLSLVGIVAFAIGVILTGAFIERKHPIPVKTSIFKVQTEIRTTNLNGVETSRDTVFIFTPRKK